MKSFLSRWLMLTLLCVWLPACGGGDYETAPVDDASGSAPSPSDEAGPAVESSPQTEGEAGEGETAQGEGGYVGDDGMIREEAPEEDENVPTDEDKDDDG